MGGFLDHGLLALKVFATLRGQRITEAHGLEKVDPQSPAIVGPQHEQGRTFADPKGEFTPGSRGWSKVSRITVAYKKGQLDSKGGKYGAKSRYHAALSYADVFAAAQASGKDSTQALVRVDSSAKEAGLGLMQAEAIRALASMHSHMSEADRRIVMMVCGQDYTPAEAVREVHGNDFKDVVPARLRVALDALIEALTATRRKPDMRSLESKL